MKIQTIDGSVAFSNGTMMRHMDRQAFLRSRIGESAREIVVNGSWITYNFRPETEVGCNAIFKNDRLHQLALQLRLPSDNTSEWSHEVETERLVVHDKWLKAELGKPPHNFSWGQVDSSLDPRDGFSGVVLTYAD